MALLLSSGSPVSTVDPEQQIDFVGLDVIVVAEREMQAGRDERRLDWYMTGGSPWGVRLSSLTYAATKVCARPVRPRGAVSAGSWPAGGWHVDSTTPSDVLAAIAMGMLATGLKGLLPGRAG